MDIFLSAEDLDRSYVDVGRIRGILAPYTNVSIIATYRRVHDWRKSWYDEIANLYLHVYLCSGGKEGFPSLMSWYGRQWQHQNASIGLSSGGIAKLQDKYEHYGFPVHMIHYHSERSLFDNIFCQIDKRVSLCKAMYDGVVQVQKKTRVSKGDILELCRWQYMTFDKVQPLLESTMNRKDKKGCTTHLYKQRSEWIIKTMEERNLTILRDVPIVRLNQSQINSMWEQTVKDEVRYYPLLSTEMEGRGTSAIDVAFWKNLKEVFDHAIISKWYSIDTDQPQPLLLSLMHEFELRYSK